MGCDDDLYGLDSQTSFNQIFEALSKQDKIDTILLQIQDILHKQPRTYENVEFGLSLVHDLKLTFQMLAEDLEQKRDREYIGMSSHNGGFVSDFYKIQIKDGILQIIAGWHTASTLRVPGTLCINVLKEAHEHMLKTSDELKSAKTFDPMVLEFEVEV